MVSLSLYTPALNEGRVVSLSLYTPALNEGRVVSLYIPALNEGRGGVTTSIYTCSQ